MVVSSNPAGASMVIKGTIDTTAIENGFRRVKNHFKSVEGESKGFTATLSRMGSAAKGVVTGLVGMGAAGAGILTGLALKAPALAGSMASISVSVGKLARGLGETLQPVMNKVAVLFEKLVAFEGEHPKLFAGILGTFAGLAALKFTGVLGLLSSIGATVPAAGLITALTALAGIAATGIAVKGIMDSLAAQTLPGNYVNIGSPEITEQFSNMNQQELLNAADWYAPDPWSIGGNGGAERTVERNAQGQIVTQEMLIEQAIENRRYQLLNHTDSGFS